MSQDHKPLLVVLYTEGFPLSDQTGKAFRIAVANIPFDDINEKQWRLCKRLLILQTKHSYMINDGIYVSGSSLLIVITRILIEFT